MATLELAGLTGREPDGTPVGPAWLRVPDGELVTLLGPPGSGKSTLVRTLAGLAETDGGELLLDGERATDWAPAERDLAVAFQDHPLYPHLSVRDNIAFGLRLVPVPEPEVRRRVEAVARELEVAVHLDRSPAQLSRPQRQRAALARALVRRPAAYLLDEPLAVQQPEVRHRLRSAVAALQRETGTTTLHLTGDQAEARAFGGRVAVLRRGRVEQADALSGPAASAYVAALLGAGLAPVTVAGGELRLGPASVPVPAGTALGGRDRVLAGVRPEHLTEIPPASGGIRLTAAVEGIDRGGPDLLAGLRLPG
ncbi:MAG TPA: ABC transporter ATP-binding protein, partial [Mycobacteriales bacterium]|nr:ABC transporter ATP-binding protein [Mycobacteriales bacterium]